MIPDGTGVKSNVNEKDYVSSLRSCPHVAGYFQKRRFLKIQDPLSPILSLGVNLSRVDVFIYRTALRGVVILAVSL